MGRRKKSAKPEKRVVNRVPSSFDCPFCNHTETVECKIDRRKGSGTIRCRICEASFQMLVGSLTEAVDIYTEWIDQCEQVHQKALNGDYNEDDEDDDEDRYNIQGIDDDDDDGEDI